MFFFFLGTIAASLALSPLSLSISLTEFSSSLISIYEAHEARRNVIASQKHKNSLGICRGVVADLNVVVRELQSRARASVSLP